MEPQSRQSSLDSIWNTAVFRRHMAHLRLSNQTQRPYHSGRSGFEIHQVTLQVALRGVETLEQERLLLMSITQPMPLSAPFPHLDPLEWVEDEDDDDD